MIFIFGFISYWLYSTLRKWNSRRESKQIEIEAKATVDAWMADEQIRIHEKIEKEQLENPASIKSSRSPHYHLHKHEHFHIDHAHADVLNLTEKKEIHLHPKK
jgi:hypothetical protein